MKKLLVLIVCFLGLFYSQSDAQISWYDEDDFDYVLEKCSKEDKILMLRFYTQSSDGGRNIFNARSIVLKSEEFTPIRLNLLGSESARDVAQRFSITGAPYLIFVNSSTMEVLARLDGNQYSTKNVLEAMQLSVTTKSILEEIKTIEEPTIETLNYYINQGDSDGAFELITNVSINSNQIYSINEPTTLYSFDDNAKAYYLDKVAELYITTQKDLEKAFEVYMYLIDNISDIKVKNYIDKSTMNGYRILQATGNSNDINEYLTNILSQKKLSKDYQKFFQELITPNTTE